MKQAILITVYKDLEAVAELAEFFGDRFNFYVHIDRKSRLDPSPLRRFGNIWLTDKYVVNWGGKSHLRAILHLSQEALANPENGFFHLITGEDFPLRTVEEFLGLDRSVNYLACRPLPTHNWAMRGGLGRVDMYHFNDTLDLKKWLPAKVARAIVALQSGLGLKRRYPEGYPKLYGGSTYWSLGREALEYVVGYTRENPQFYRRFDHTHCAEEIYFQTVIMDSPLAASVVNNNLRHVDWTAGGASPKVLDESDFERVVSSDKFFARKFDRAVSAGLKKKIEEYLADKAGGM